jgi:hypothetical protein
LEYRTREKIIVHIRSVSICVTTGSLASAGRDIVFIASCTLFATLSTSALFSRVAITVDTLSDDVESIESIQSSHDILSSIFFVMRESISSGLHPGYTVTTVTIHRLISGKDSFGIR